MNQCTRGARFPERRARRRKEAEERAAARALRTTEQQLAKLDEGGHAAARERNRLTALAAGR